MRINWNKFIDDCFEYEKRAKQQVVDAERQKFNDFWTLDRMMAYGILPMKVGPDTYMVSDEIHKKMMAIYKRSK